MEEKIKALAEYLGIDESEITENELGELETLSGETYRVLDADEANEATKENIESFIDEQGIEGFTPNFQECIKRNALDEGFFHDICVENYQQYVDDIEGSDDDEYGTELIAELIKYGVIEDGDQFKDDFDIDDAKEELVGRLVSNVDDYVDEYIDAFGGLDELLEQHPEILDIDALVETAIDWDGRGHFLASYDGDELELDDGYFAYRVD